MPGLYSHTSRATGITLTAAIYNADHQNHIDNQTPQMTDDYSVDTAQMQSTTDPGEVATESKPTTLAGELERLRFAIKELKQWCLGTIAQWYESPTAQAVVSEDTRTDSVATGLTVTRTTTGVPAAGIGVRLLLRGESADEAPSDFAAIDAVATTVGAGAEVTVLDVLLRVAGAALAATWRFAATGAFRGIFTHANTADRTYTLPNASGTLALAGVSALAWAGGSTTEVTTTDTTDGDRVTVSGLSIPATAPILVLVQFAKSSGAAANVEIGLKLNATVLGGDARGVTDSTNEEQTGTALFVIGPRLAGATVGYDGGLQIAASRGATGSYEHIVYSLSGRPNATITDVIVRGRTTNGSVTFYIMGVHVYTLPTS